MNAILAIGSVTIKELLRRKDFYVLFILTALITLLLGSVNLFNDDKIVRYLKEICLLLIWISALVIAITTAARQIPAEREQRTIFPLLAKPVTRGQVLLGKFAGCWLASLLCLAVFYLFFGLVSGTREQHWPVLQYLQAFWLHGCFLAIVISMTLLGSVVFAAPSSTTTILLVVTGGILLLGRHLSKVALHSGEPLASFLSVLYYTLPHLEFYDVRDLIIHDWPALAAWVCGAATAYGAAYTTLFLIGAWWTFRRQPLN